MTQTPAQQAALRRTQETQQARAAARIEDLEFLINHGTDLQAAVRRAGFVTIDAAKASVRRNGRRDLLPRLNAKETRHDHAG